MISSNDEHGNDRFPRWIGVMFAMALIALLIANCAGCANQGARLPAPIPVELQRAPGK